MLLPARIHSFVLCGAEIISLLEQSGFKGGFMLTAPCSAQATARLAGHLLDSTWQTKALPFLLIMRMCLSCVLCGRAMAGCFTSRRHILPCCDQPWPDAACLSCPGEVVLTRAADEECLQIVHVWRPDAATKQES
jgi:hypothetical protein